MLFTIDPSSTLNDVSIQIQAMKNTITVYFRGKENNAREAITNWQFLDNNFINTLPHYSSSFRGKPIGKHDDSENKAIPIQLCRHFSSEVTPSIVEKYLNEFYTQQEYHQENKYQFLTKQKINEFQSHYVQPSENNMPVSKKKSTDKEAVGLDLDKPGSEDFKPSIFIDAVLANNHPLFSAFPLLNNEPNHNIDWEQAPGCIIL